MKKISKRTMIIIACAIVLISTIALMSFNNQNGQEDVINADSISPSNITFSPSASASVPASSVITHPAISPGISPQPTKSILSTQAPLTTAKYGIQPTATSMIINPTTTKAPIITPLPTPMPSPSSSVITEGWPLITTPITWQIARNLFQVTPNPQDWAVQAEGIPTVLYTYKYNLGTIDAKFDSFANSINSGMTISGPYPVIKTNRDLYYHYDYTAIISGINRYLNDNYCKNGVVETYFLSHNSLAYCTQFDGQVIRGRLYEKNANGEWKYRDVECFTSGAVYAWLSNDWQSCNAPK